MSFSISGTWLPCRTPSSGASSRWGVDQSDAFITTVDQSQVAEDLLEAGSSPDMTEHSRGLSLLMMAGQEGNRSVLTNQSPSMTPLTNHTGPWWSSCCPGGPTPATRPRWGTRPCLWPGPGVTTLWPGSSPSTPPPPSPSPCPPSRPPPRSRWCWSRRSSLRVRTRQLCQIYWKTWVDIVHRVEIRFLSSNFSI